MENPPCLGSNLEVETKDALAQGDAALLETMRSAIYHKPVAHHFNTG
jgi:hypothetical protein